MALLQQVPIGSLSLEHFAPLLPPERYGELEEAVQRSREVHDFLAARSLMQHLDLIQRLLKA